MELELICFILIVGFVGMIGLAIYAFKCLGREWSFKLLFKDFNRKMWMTLNLGWLFFILYFLIIDICIYLIKMSKTDLLFLFQRDPIAFIYGGLWIFICLSFCIYFVRMVIKYIYMIKGKDS